jgi:hypothetical protein
MRSRSRGCQYSPVEYVDIDIEHYAHIHLHCLSVWINSVHSFIYLERTFSPWVFVLSGWRFSPGPRPNGERMIINSLITCFVTLMEQRGLAVGM